MSILPLRISHILVDIFSLWLYIVLYLSTIALQFCEDFKMRRSKAEPHEEPRRAGVMLRLRTILKRRESQKQLVEVADQGTQTQTSLGPKHPPPTHKDHPELLYPRFWPNLLQSAQWRTDGNVGFNCTTVQNPIPAEEYKLAQTMIKYANGWHDIQGYIVPLNAVSVSIATENFVAGKNCFEFIPADKNLQGPWHLTYHLICERLQATYFNYNGVQYLAGVCYMMKLSGDTGGGGTSSATDVNETPRGVAGESAALNLSQNAFEVTWLARRRFPVEHITHDEQLYGVDCQRLRKRILVGYDDSHQKILHYNYNNATSEIWKEFCSKCNSMEKTSSRYFAAKMGIELIQPDDDKTTDEDTDSIAKEDAPAAPQEPPKDSDSKAKEEKDYYEDLMKALQEYGKLEPDEPLMPYESPLLGECICQSSNFCKYFKASSKVIVRDDEEEIIFEIPREDFEELGAPKPEWKFSEANTARVSDDNLGGISMETIGKALADFTAGGPGSSSADDDDIGVISRSDALSDVDASVGSDVDDYERDFSDIE